MSEHEKYDYIYNLTCIFFRNTLANFEFTQYITQSEQSSLHLRNPSGSSLNFNYTKTNKKCWKIFAQTPS